MSELQRKANEVQSRFSLSGYYKSQVKDPTPEMLAEMKSMVDPETGEVVKVKRTRRVAKKDGEGDGVEKSDASSKEKSASSKEKSAPSKAKGRGRKKEEMILESDSESEEPMELTDSESEDDVIRDNRAALAARKSQEVKEVAKDAVKESPKEVETPVKRKSVKRVIETPTKSPVKETPKKSPVKETPKKSPMKESPKKSPAKETPKKSPSKETPKKSPSKDTPKKSPTKVMTISDDSDEDTYIPLGERLKMKMQNDQRSSIVDELANTKSSVPASKRRRTTKKTTEDAKKPAKKPARKPAKKRDDSDDSDDSLFGF